jgi:RimJ/RimL family protein N-acetyltransferase
MEFAMPFSPVINLTGMLVALGPLERAYLPLYHRWSNDLEASRTSGVGWPVTLDDEIAAFERQVSDRQERHFTIFEGASLRPVGRCALLDLSERHARATFTILIGEADARGRGFGTEATSLTLGYAFNMLGLSNVMLTCLAFNSAGLRAYEKAGFREFGRRHAASRWGQTLWDLVYMECTASPVSSGTSGSESV